MILNKEPSKHAKLPDTDVFGKYTRFHLIDTGAVANKVFMSACSAGAVWTKDHISAEIAHRVSMELYRQQWLYKDSMLVLLYDSKPYWRKEILPEYKESKSRGMMPKLADDLGYTRAMLWQDFDIASEQWLEMNGGTSVRAESTEADDLAYILATSPAGKKFKLSAYCNDADWTQLSRWSPDTEVLFYGRKRPDGTTGELVEHLSVEEATNQLLLKVASGDSSDNIKGAFIKKNKDGEFGAQRWGEKGLLSLAEKDYNGSLKDLILDFRKEEMYNESWLFNWSLISMKMIPQYIVQRGLDAIKGAKKHKRPADVAKYYAQGGDAYDYLLNYYGEEFTK